MWEWDSQSYVWVGIITTTCVVLTASIAISGYRHLVSIITESDALPFHVLGFILGIPVKVASHPADVRHMLTISNVKGQFLEQRVACAAWFPVRNATVPSDVVTGTQGVIVTD